MDFLSLVQIANAAVDSAAFGNVVNPIIEHIVYPIIMFMFALALVVFVYGVIQMMVNGADDSEARKKGQNTILYGAIGMFIMVSAWGIIRLISSTIIGVV